MCVWYGSGNFRRHQCLRRSEDTSGAIKSVGSEVGGGGTDLNLRV